MSFEQSFEGRGSTAVEVIGRVLSCRGAGAKVGLVGSAPLSEHRATVGKLIAIRNGKTRQIGMISEVTAATAELAGDDCHAIATVDLMGEIEEQVEGLPTFRRGLRNYPAIGDAAELIRRPDLRAVYSSVGARSISVGQLHQDASIPAYVDVDNLLAKHFAILGSTGVGKSSGVAVILNEIARVRPDVRVLLLDVHNEYARCLGPRAHIIGHDEFRLPFWMLNFDEFTDVIYGGKPVIAEETDILVDLIPIAKGMYHNMKAERSTLARRTAKGPGFSPDTPAPYLIQDLLQLIDERMGRLENRSVRMVHHRLILRIEGLINDPRYAFMFENANVGGDIMGAVLNQLFQLEADKGGATVLQLASLPGEAIDALVCVVARLTFEFGMWSDGAIPLLTVVEEAHRFASADHTTGFAPARRALSRIAKEGRKYGIHLGMVTQRPAELDPTILSQCSTLFIMRMANDEDHAIMRSAASLNAANMLEFLPSLGTGEAVGVGEGMPLSARFTFRVLPRQAQPHSELPNPLDDPSAAVSEIVQRSIDRWRRATMSQSPAATPEAEQPAVQVAAAAETLGAVARGLRTLHEDSRDLTRRPFDSERGFLHNLPRGGS